MAKSSLAPMLAGDQPELMPNEKSTHVSGDVFQSEDQLIKRGYRPHIQGTGFLVTPSLVVTNRKVVQSAENNLSYTITQYPEDGKPTLVGGSVVKWSPVQDEDLAIIRLDRAVDSDPLRIIDNDGNAVVGDEITVLGFPETFSTGEHLLASGGQIDDFDPRKSWFFLTADLLQGNSGGPCVDMHGNVCGVAFERDKDDILTFGKRNERDYDVKGIAVSATPLVQFIKSVDADYQQLPPHADKVFNRQNLTDHIRPSVFLIKSWKSPLARQRTVGQFGEEINAREIRNLETATLKENRLYPDLWCFTCRGGGSLKCTNPNCARGQIQERRRVVVGTDPNFGKKIYAYKRFFEKCPTCSGAGRIKCPHCIEGKLKLE